MTDYITEFGAERFTTAFSACADPCGCGDPALCEWPNNVLSIRTRVYDSGVIARSDQPVVHRVDPEELARCERLAARAGVIMGRHPVGMKSEADEPFHPYFQLASADAQGILPGAPKVVDAALVRKLFAHTIAPFDYVFVEPLREGGFFWKDASADVFEEEYSPEKWAEINPEKVLARWRELIRFFDECDELVQPSFASIGFNEYSPPAGANVLDETEPPGFEMKGSCLPRMPFAFTHAGSLVGLFGYVVWT